MNYSQAIDNIISQVQNKTVFKIDRIKDEILISVEGHRIDCLVIIYSTGVRYKLSQLSTENDRGYLLSCMELFTVINEIMYKIESLKIELPKKMIENEDFTERADNY